MESLTKYFDSDNKDGTCSLQQCYGTLDSHPGTLEHMLLTCPSLGQARMEFDVFKTRHLSEYPLLADIVDSCLCEDPIQFYLDASTMPQVILAVQEHGDDILFPIFKLTRHYCYLHHSLRMNYLSSI